ncbi:hypothetical protein ACIBG0_08015 [Nocardia sp. NPDC050630]
MRRTTRTLNRKALETLAAQSVTGKAARARVGAALDRWRDKSPE